MEVNPNPGGDAFPRDEQLPRRLQERPILNGLRTEKVVSNCYTIRFKKAVKLHQYEFKFQADVGREIAKDLSQGLKTDVGSEGRRRLLWDLWLQLINNNKHLFSDPSNFVFDCGLMVVSPVELKLKNIPEKIILNPDLLKPETRAYLPRMIKELFVEIKHIDEVQIDSQRLNADCTTEKGRLALQLLEVIYNQKIVSGNNFHVFPQKSFLKQENRGDIDGRVIKDGVAKGVRYAGDSAHMGLILQAEIVKSAFFPSQNLLDYLLRHFNCRGIDDLQRKFGERSDRTKLDREVKKLTLMTTHLQKNRIFISNGFDTMAARDRNFSVEEKDKDGVVTKRQNINVVDYMRQKYRLNIQAYNLPCIVQNTRDRDGQRTQNFYPIDILRIVDGQRVPLQKMDPRFQDKMIKQCRMNPDQMQKVAKDVMNTAQLNDRNEYARRFEVPLDSRQVQVDAKMLPAPAILFGGNARDEPDNNGLKWKPPQNRRYLIPGTCAKWLVVNYNRCINERDLDDFIKKFVAKLIERGTRIERTPTAVIIESRVEKISDAARGNEVNFVLVVTRDKLDPVHDSLKHFEINSKIVTQHLWVNTVLNIVQKNQQMTLENVVMKTNEKLGGTNFTAGSSRLLDLATGTRGVLESKWLGDDRLFIGLELSGSGQRSDEKNKLPSVVGMVYNVNESLSLTGHYFYREANRNIIVNLAQEFAASIMAYKTRSKGRKWPSHIFIYRAGVSEGEYAQVNHYEKNALLHCLNELKKKHNDFVMPGFTLIVAQRNNGFRLFPVNPSQNARNDAERNLKPGTIIDGGIVNPILKQFILVAHRTIQGTCRPILYTVLSEQPKAGGKPIPLDELKYVTYALCHLHNDVLGTVNVPSVLYHAGQVAKRGSNNLKVQLFGSTNDDSTNSERRNQPNVKQDGDYVDTLSRQLHVSLDNKYWA